MRTLLPNKRPLCKCGCGNPVEWNKWDRKWNVFINGHNQKGKINGKDNPMYDKKHSIQTKKKMILSHTGKKHSKETKRKIREKAMGRKCSEKTKKKISRSCMGRELSDKHKEKLLLANTGRKFSVETILKISGKNNSQWKGGISCEPYCIDWTKEYKEYIKERDDHHCHNPDCWGNCDHLPLHVHHIDYIKKNCAPRNLITLCNSCNIRANTNREEWTIFYREIIKQKYKLKEAA